MVYILIKHSTKGFGWWKEKADATPHIAFLLVNGLMKRRWRFIILVINILGYPIINSSDFHPSSSPLWERQHYPSLYAYMRTCNHAGTAARDTIRGWQKEKQRQANITAIGFWKTKSHSSLGRFLHAPLTLMLKMPQWTSGVAPLWTPRLFQKQQQAVLWVAQRLMSYSKVGALFFYGSKFVFQAYQNWLAPCSKKFDVYIVA